MKTKTYIALLLTFIFMAKFVAIDANGLNTLFNSNSISFVKLNCKKNNVPKQTNKTADFSQADPTASQVIALNSFCTSQFHFELHTWDTYVVELIAVFNEYFSSNLSYRYLENVSPPPRLA